MQNKSSKITQILLVIIAIALIVIIILFVRRNTRPTTLTDSYDSGSGDAVSNQVSITSQEKTSSVTTSATEKYTSAKLGFSFEYPKEWGTVKEDMGQDKNGFIYIVSFTNAKVAIQGLSYPYTSEGRETFEADLKESDLNDTCEKNINEPVFTKDGTEGVYTYALITTGMGDCSDYDTRHFAIFDVNKKVTNIVITGKKDMDTKLFKDFVSSITINK